MNKSKYMAVKVAKVSKKYILEHQKPTLVEAMLKRGEAEEFFALKDISLEVKKGESVGLIGPNGAGKTTLLEIIAGITAPTDGEVDTSGKLVSLIDLEAGFHPELTGEENVFLNGLLVGMSKTEVEEKFKDIVNFADLGGFIDAPFYTYSSGMRLRLGFSVAVHSEPDIILLDENMAVGDREFKKKSFGKIAGLVSEGKTLIMATHSMELLTKVCQKAVWLQEGTIKIYDKISRVENLFEEFYGESLV